MQKIYILIVLTLFLFSCKGEQKQEQVIDQPSAIDAIENKALKNTTVVTLKGVFEKDDKFQLLYTESKEENYTSKKIITKKIIGSYSEQEITYILPKGIYPSKIRLDFGKNKEQGAIMINSVSISLESQVIEISNTEFLSYFKPNSWISKINVSNESEYKLIVKELKVSSNNTVSYAPYFSATNKLISELEAL